MLIIIGNFIEISEDYLKKFKIQIESYKSSFEKDEEKVISEKQQIKNEFIYTSIPIFDNSIDKNYGILQRRADNISEEHRKKINKAKRKEKRKIRAARTFKIAGHIFLSKTLLELSLKKYKEIESNRILLEKELDADWQKFNSYIQDSSEVIESYIEDMVDETVIAERMNTAELKKRRTNEELENVLGEQILGEAIQDKHGIENVFQKLLYKFSKKHEREDR